MNEAQLKTIWQNRQARNRTKLLSEPLTMFMKHTLSKRVKQLAKISKVWAELIPPALANHTALESLSRSVLTVAVDTAAHRFKLQQCLNAGMMKKIQDQYNAPLNKIRVVARQFRKTDDAGGERYDFYLPTQK